MTVKNVINENAEFIMGMGKSVVKFSKTKIEEDKYTGLHKSSPRNSTDFTNCCHCAVTSKQNKCPECGALIYGRQS